MLIDFTLEFPKLPYVSPPTAEVRARSCLRREGGVLTLQIKEEIHDFFACDAAGLSLALYIPEVYAREQMMKLPSFQACSHLSLACGPEISCLCAPPVAGPEFAR